MAIRPKTTPRLAKPAKPHGPITCRRALPADFDDWRHHGALSNTRDGTRRARRAAVAPAWILSRSEERSAGVTRQERLVPPFVGSSGGQRMKPEDLLMACPKVRRVADGG